MTAIRRPSPLLLATLVVIGIVAVQALLVPLFAGGASNLEPRDLPVAVAGPPPAADQLAAGLGQAAPEAFDVIRVADQAAADQALRDREAYAALVAGPEGVTLRTASAASPVVAQLLTQAVTELSGGRPQVVDVVPASPDDPRGAGFAAGFLPLVLTSMLAGIALVVVASTRWVRLGAVAGYAVLAGLAGAAVLGGWLGVLGGDYLANAAAIGLLALAVSGAVAGLGAALGEPGIGLGAVLTFLVANPLSAAAAAPELLPQPWGEVGQWLPAGAGATLLRSVAWFDGAGAGAALWALAGWAGIGLLLLLVGRARVGAPPRGVGRPSPGLDLGGAPLLKDASR